MSCPSDKEFGTTELSKGVTELSKREFGTTNLSKGASEFDFDVSILRILGEDLYP